MTPTRSEAHVEATRALHAPHATYAMYPSLLGVPVPARAFGLAAGWCRFDESAIAHEATTVSSQTTTQQADKPAVMPIAWPRRRATDRENRDLLWSRRKASPFEVAAA